VIKAIANDLADNHLAKLKAKAIDAFHAGHDHDGKHDGHDKHDKPWQSHDDDRSNHRVEKVVKQASDWLRSGRLDRWASDLASHRRGAA
jgi:hypothetical protein